MRVNGNARPLIVNPAPVTLAAEMVRLEPPELVSVSLSVLLLPTVTLPKLKLVGLGVIWPCVTPVPESAMLRGELLASEMIARFPVLLPEDVGEKIALNVVLCPAARVAGRPGPLKLNPVPVAAAAEIVTVTPPVLVTVTGTV